MINQGCPGCDTSLRFSRLFLISFMGGHCRCCGARLEYSPHFTKYFYVIFFTAMFAWMRFREETSLLELYAALLLFTVPGCFVVMLKGQLIVKENTTSSGYVDTRTVKEVSYQVPEQGDLRHMYRVLFVLGVAVLLILALVSWIV